MGVAFYDLGAIGRLGTGGDTEVVPIILRDLGASVSAFLSGNALNGRATNLVALFLSAFIPGVSLAC